MQDSRGKFHTEDVCQVQLGVQGPELNMFVAGPSDYASPGVDVQMADIHNFWPFPMRWKSTSSNSVIVSVCCRHRIKYPSPVPEQSTCWSSSFWLNHVTQVMGSPEVCIWLGCGSWTIRCRSHIRNPLKPADTEFMNLGNRTLPTAACEKATRGGYC